MLGRIKKLHFVGIGGIGMSGIAELLLNQGFQITGSDLNQTEITENLVKKGARIAKGHDPELIRGCDVVVKSSAAFTELISPKAITLNAIYFIYSPLNILHFNTKI